MRPEVAKEMAAYGALGYLRSLRDFGHIPEWHRAGVDEVLKMAEDADSERLLNTLLAEEDRARAEQDAQDVQIEMDALNEEGTQAAHSHTEQR